MALELLEHSQNASTNPADELNECDICSYGCSCELYAPLAELPDLNLPKPPKTPMVEVAEAEKLIADHGGLIARKLAGFAARRFWNSGYGSYEPVDDKTLAENLGNWMAVMLEKPDAPPASDITERYVEHQPLRGKLAYMAIMSLKESAERRQRASSV